MNQSIKTFNDLHFDIHPGFKSLPGKTIAARLDLGNDIEISAINGPKHYSDPGESYEVAMFHHGHMLQLSEYDKVLPYQTAHEIELLMKAAQMDPLFVDKLPEEK